VARNILAYIPLPNAVGNGFGQNNFSAPSNPRSDKYDIHNFRFDHSLNEQNKFFVDVARSNRHEVNGTAGFVGAASPAYLHWRINTGVIADLTTILSPTLVLDSKVSFVRHVFAIARHSNGFDPTQLGFPSSFVSQLGAVSFPQIMVGSYLANTFCACLSWTGSTYTYTNTFSWTETVSKIIASHSLRTGLNIRIIRNNVANPTSSAGSFTFDQGFTQQNPTQPSGTAGDAFASFLLGTPASSSVPVNSSFAYQNLYWAGFLQDDWRVNSRLTLNLGVRWDYESPPSERLNRQNAGFAFDVLSPLQVPGFRPLYGGLVFTGNGSNRLPFRRDLNNFQPRVGLAYRITTNTVFRAGYGITYLPTFDIGQNNGFNISTDFISSTNGGLIPIRI
jgi:outer membrane receptor protein involved in Fe transport